MRRRALGVVAVITTLATPLAGRAQEVPLETEPETVASGQPHCLLDPGADNKIFFQRRVADWRDGVPTAELVRCAAPILWFSPDEPLLPAAKATPLGIPEAYQGRATRAGCWNRPRPAGVPTVYHDARVLRTDHSEARAREGRSHLTVGMVRYLFYYGCDVGAGGHAGDLEEARFSFELYYTPDGVYEAKLTSVRAPVHGNFYAFNRLGVDTAFGHANDVRLPLTLLVEEGKHAICPDRNGDGIYNPGYDVNSNVHDAWGVRDTFASAVVSSAFNTSMQKIDRVHHPHHRVFPDIARDDPAVARWEQGGDTWGAGLYELQEAPRGPSVVEDDHAPRPLPEPTYWGAVGTAYRDALLVYLPFGVRWWGGTRSYVLTQPILTSDGFPFWPKLAFPYLKYSAGVRLELAPSADGGHHVRCDFLLSPSLARLADWYFAAGRRDGRWEYEGGLRLRLKTNWFHNHFPLLGARLGVRTSGWAVSNSRFVLEVGGGFF